MDTLDPSVSPVIVYSVLPEVLVPPPASAAPERGELVIGMIGRLAPWKGQDLFLRAFAEAFPGDGARCALVGSSMFGEQGYEAELRALVRELHLEDRVEFRGFRNDVWSELGRMDILVHASLTPEPFGQIVLEGFAAGVPVVAANAGGPAEVIEHDVNGVLYRMGDGHALADALKQLAGDPVRRQRLAEAGLIAVAGYHPDAVVERLQAVYRNVITRASARLSATDQ